MTEYEPSPEDDELEATIRRLFYRLEDAREGSAEHRMIVRQLIGLREGSEVGRLIFEVQYDRARDLRLAIPELIGRDAKPQY